MIPKQKQRAQGLILPRARFAMVIGLSLTFLAQETTWAAEKEKAECQQEVAKLRKDYANIPTDFRGLSRAKIEEYAALVARTRDRLEVYVENCEGGCATADAYFMLARLRVSLADRQRSDWRNRDKFPAEQLTQMMRDYHKRNLALLKKSLDCLENAKEDTSSLPATLRCEVVDLTGDIHLQNGDNAEALKFYEKVLETCADYDDIGNTISGAGRCYLRLRRAEEGVPFIRNAIKTHYSNANLPFFYESLWQLLTVQGDPELMSDHCKDVKKIFPLRMLRQNIGKVERDAYHRYLGYNGFRLGYSLFAQGELEAAKAAFEEHVETLNKQTQELTDQGRALPQELRIYRQRSVDNLAVLKERVGDPPGKDLDCEEYWITPERVTIAGSEGKAVAVLFRGYGDKRSASFLKALDTHAGTKPDTFPLVVIHYFKGDKDPLGQMEKLQDEIAELQIDNAAVGMDPDPKSKSIFRGIGAMVGTATFMIFDKQGRLAWWQQDPRDMDNQMAITIWKRLAEE